MEISQPSSTSRWYPAAYPPVYLPTLPYPPIPPHNPTSSIIPFYSSFFPCPTFLKRKPRMEEEKPRCAGVRLIFTGRCPIRQLEEKSTEPLHEKVDANA